MKRLCLWFNYLISFTLVFSFMYCWAHIYVLSPFYISICMYKEMLHRGVKDLSCESNIYLYWTTLEIRVRLVPSNIIKPPVIFLLSIPRRCFFCGPCFLFVFRVILSCLFLAALWSPAGKGLNSWHSCMWCLLVFWHSPFDVMVKWGIWLSGFLIVVFFFTFII